MRPPQTVIEALRKHVQQQRLYEEKHGLGRPIIHTSLHGYKIVAVGNEIHWTKEETCKFFPDFVGKYLKTVLGEEWGKAELAKPLEERHQILKWYDSLCRYQQSIPREADGTFAASPNGASMAWYRLAYDLYLIRHNARLQNRILDRLRNRVQFQGARYELAVAATFIVAGFDIEYEDEDDVGVKHPEFLAKHRATGSEVSVEAKSRHRHGVLGFVDEKAAADGRVGIRNLLWKALEKNPPRPFLVFVDLNLPYRPEPVHKTDWFPEVRETVDDLEGRCSPGEYPASALFFTNDPSHYTPERVSDGGPDYWSFATKCKEAKFPLPHDGWLEAVLKAFQQRGHIPNEFPSDEPLQV